MKVYVAFRLENIGLSLIFNIPIPYSQEQSNERFGEMSEKSCHHLPRGFLPLATDCYRHLQSSQGYILPVNIGLPARAFSAYAPLLPRPPFFVAFCRLTLGPCSLRSQAREAVRRPSLTSCIDLTYGAVARLRQKRGLTLAMALVSIRNF